MYKRVAWCIWDASRLLLLMIEPPPCFANGALKIIHSMAGATKVKEVWVKVFSHQLAD